MQRKPIYAVISLITALVFLLAACGGGNSQNKANPNNGANGAADEQTQNEGAGEPTAKVAIVFATGGLGDRNFNDVAYAGIKRAEAELGIEFDFVEPQAIAEFETFHRDFASSGDYDLIIGISFDQLDAITNVSAEFPDQKFFLLDTAFTGDAPNVASAVFKAQESSFLAGAIAAKQSQTKKIGFIGGTDNELINEFLSGYMAGAKYIDPSVEVLYNYTNAWDNPNLGKEMTVSMYESGADIVYAAAGGSGNGVFTAAKEQGKWSIGADMTPAQEPDNMIIGTLKHIDNAIFDNIKAVIDGTWEPGLMSLGLEDGGVGYTVEGSEIEIPQEYLDLAEELKEKIISGEIEVPRTLAEVDAFLANQS